MVCNRFAPLWLLLVSTVAGVRLEERKWIFNLFGQPLTDKSVRMDEEQGPIRNHESGPEERHQPITQDLLSLESTENIQQTLLSCDKALVAYLDGHETVNYVGFEEFLLPFGELQPLLQCYANVPQYLGTLSDARIPQNREQLRTQFENAVEQTNWTAEWKANFRKTFMEKDEEPTVYSVKDLDNNLEEGFSKTIEAVERLNNIVGQTSSSRETSTIDTDAGNSSRSLSTKMIVSFFIEDGSLHLEEDGISEETVAAIKNVSSSLTRYKLKCSSAGDSSIRSRSLDYSGLLCKSELWTLVHMLKPMAQAVNTKQIGELWVSFRMLWLRSVVYMDEDSKHDIIQQQRMLDSMPQLPAIDIDKAKKLDELPEPLKLKNDQDKCVVQFLYPYDLSGTGAQMILSRFMAKLRNTIVGQRLGERLIFEDAALVGTSVGPMAVRFVDFPVYAPSSRLDDSLIFAQWRPFAHFMNNFDFVDQTTAPTDDEMREARDKLVELQVRLLLGVEESKLVPYKTDRREVSTQAF